MRQKAVDLCHFKFVTFQTHGNPISRFRDAGFRIFADSTLKCAVIQRRFCQLIPAGRLRVIAEIEVRLKIEAVPSCELNRLALRADWIIRALDYGIGNLYFIVTADIQTRYAPAFGTELNESVLGI